MNKVILMGRITQDLEVKTFKETKVLKFSIAVRRDKDNTDFINCVTFNKTAEMIEKFFSKGSMISVVGKIQAGSYEKDGKKVYTFDINVNEFYFCGESKKDELNDSTKLKTNGHKQTIELNVDGDDLPF